MRNRRVFYFALVMAVTVLCLGCQSRINAETKPGNSVLDTNAEPFYYEFKGVTDLTVWDKTFTTFDGNLCAFRPEETIDGAGSISLFIKKLSTPALGKNYGGGQLWSKRFFTYGRFSVRMKVPIVSGTVGAFFLMNAITPGNWLHKEIDIEFLGKDRHMVQFNVHRYYVQTESSAGTPYIHTASYDYGADFHTYAIVWKPAVIEWYIDDVKVYEFTQKIPDEPLQILMNAWIADPSYGVGWLGALNDADLPCHAEYQWVKYEPL